MCKSFNFKKGNWKMTWNYRVISHPSWNTWDKEGERIYKIHEVFSDETGIIGYSANGCEP